MCLPCLSSLFGGGEFFLSYMAIFAFSLLAMIAFFFSHEISAAAAMMVKNWKQTLFLSVVSSLLIGSSVAVILIFPPA